MLPRVVIVGRMNVGKSTLFNRFATSIRSLTLDFAGLTRDLIKDTVTVDGRSFELIDTGGISLRKTNDIILEKVRNVALQALHDAAVIVFVIDGTVGILPEDREIAQHLYKMKKTVILAINKVDNHKTYEHLLEVNSLGFSHTIEISAQHGTHVYELGQLILSLLVQQPSKQLDQKRAFRVVFIGKPNVGKSSLMNALLKQERSIVSEVAGTTREAISEDITFYQEHIQLTDTPGLRRKRGVTQEVEHMMVKSSMQALKDADIVVLLIDGSEAKICDQELKLAFYAFTDHYKALIILVNKYDLMTPESQAALDLSLSHYKHLLDKVPLMHVSCTTGKNIGRLLPLLKKVWQRYSQQFDEAALQAYLLAEFFKCPFAQQEQPLKLSHIRQVKTAPPTIALYVNQPDRFSPSELQFFENRMRKKYDLIGAAVRFFLKKTE